jgi:hypothetical protein
MRKPDLDSFERAIELMCSIPQCEAFMDDVAHREEHLRGKWDLENPDIHTHGLAHSEGFQYGHLGLHGYLPMHLHCEQSHATELCLAGSLYFLVPETGVEEMTCCQASQILLGELSSQGLATPGIPTCPEDAACDEYGHVSDTYLQSAKDLLRNDDACFAALDDVIQNERSLNQFPSYVAEATGFFRGDRKSVV